jgi:hypothetical protein
MCSKITGGGSHGHSGPNERREAVREERAGQPLAPEQRDKPGASSYQQETPKNSEVM